jgi:hypothetical protein
VETDLESPLLLTHTLQILGKLFPNNLNFPWKGISLGSLSLSNWTDLSFPLPLLQPPHRTCTVLELLMFRATTDTGGLGRGRDQSDEGLTCHHEVQSFRVPRSRGRRGGLGTVVRDPAPEGTLMESPDGESTQGTSYWHFDPHGTSTKHLVHCDICPSNILTPPVAVSRDFTYTPPRPWNGRYVTCDITTTSVSWFVTFDPCLSDVNQVSNCHSSPGMTWRSPPTHGSVCLVP